MLTNLTLDQIRGAALATPTFREQTVTIPEDSPTLPGVTFLIREPTQAQRGAIFSACTANGKPTPDTVVKMPLLCLIHLVRYNGAPVFTLADYDTLVALPVSHPLIAIVATAAQEMMSGGKGKGADTSPPTNS